MACSGYRMAVQPPRDPRPILVNLNTYYVILIYFDRPQTFDRPPRSVSTPTYNASNTVYYTHTPGRRHPKEGEYLITSQ